jgi:riboflavin kinase/FMN adenylyltransferase
MLRLLVEEARKRGLSTRVLTFEPHPRVFFAAQKQLVEPIQPTQPTQQSPSTELAKPAWRISLLRNKLQIMAQIGIDEVLVLPFRHHLATLSAVAFVDKVLCQGLNTRLLIVGDDFHFGAGRTGNEALLADLAPHKGFELLPMPAQMKDGQRVSSSLIREAFRRGDLAAVERQLGYLYTLSARVGYGAQRGRQLGFPTLNLTLRGGPLVCEGIFAAQVRGLGPEPLWAAASLGVRPTISVSGPARQTLEVHVLDWPAHLGSEGGYGRLIHVRLRAYLGPQQRYADLATLRTAIERDVNRVQDLSFFLSLGDEKKSDA